MKLNPVTVIGYTVLGVGAFWFVIGVGVSRHYDPGQGSITSSKDWGYFVGVEASRMGNAMGHVFFEKQLMEKGAIESQPILPTNNFCYPWDKACNSEKINRENYQQRRQAY